MMRLQRLQSGGGIVVDASEELDCADLQVGIKDVVVDSLVGD